MRRGTLRSELGPDNPEDLGSKASGMQLALQHCARARAPMSLGYTTSGVCLTHFAARAGEAPGLQLALRPEERRRARALRVALRKTHPHLCQIPPESLQPSSDVVSKVPGLHGWSS